MSEDLNKLYDSHISTDVTANLVMSVLRQRLQAAEERAEKLEGALKAVRLVLFEQGDNTCGRNCEAMYDARFFFADEIALIDAALKTEGA